jgi:hypothetical protein
VDFSNGVDLRRGAVFVDDGHAGGGVAVGAVVAHNDAVPLPAKLPAQSESIKATAAVSATGDFFPRVFIEVSPFRMFEVDGARPRRHGELPTPVPRAFGDERRRPGRFIFL